MNCRLLAAALALLFTLSVAAPAHGQEWRTFKSASLGLRMNYPAGWRVSQSASTEGPGVQFSKSGNPPYSLAVLLLSLKPARTIRQTAAKYLRSPGPNAVSLAHAHFRAIRVHGTPALLALQWPTTEGGVAISLAIYLMQSRSRAYEVTVTAYAPKRIRSVAGFPRVYAAMLATWHAS